MAQNLKISKGEVIVTTTGECSDYGIDGFLVAIADFDMATEAQAHVVALRKISEYEEGYDGFTAYLTAKELVVPVRYREIHLGSYSRFNGSFNVPDKD